MENSVQIQDHVKFWTLWLQGKLPVPLVIPNDSECRRLSHCCKISDKFNLSKESISANSIPRLQKTGYAYDWYKMISVDDKRNCHVLFGDVQYTPEEPAFCKSRPITSNNENNVLLPLNTSRHFLSHADRLPFDKKSDTAIWRGAAYKDLRKKFLKSASDFQLIDAADTSRYSNRNFLGQSLNHLSIRDQLNHKFIFALEGNDVASNLKWIMASNSVPIMPRPQFETWFCESLLIPGQHYIEVDSDFTNMENVLDYFISRPKLTKEIAMESKLYAEQFFNIPRQFGLGREVIECYFSLVQVR